MTASERVSKKCGALGAGRPARETWDMTYRQKSRRVVVSALCLFGGVSVGGVSVGGAAETARPGFSVTGNVTLPTTRPSTVRISPATRNAQLRAQRARMRSIIRREVPEIRQLEQFRAMQAAAIKRAADRRRSGR